VNNLSKEQFLGCVELAGASQGYILQILVQLRELPAGQRLVGLNKP
jgi:hypothetical protein